MTMPPVTLETLVDAYIPLKSEPADVKDRFKALLKLPGCFDRTHFIPGHITGSAWVMDVAQNKLLMTHHAKLDMWVQLGGHSDGDPDTLGVARREALEESGLKLVEPLEIAIFDLDIHEIPARKGDPAHLHYDVRFAFKVVGDTTLQISDESHDLKWVPMSEIDSYSNEESIRRMARKWQTLRERISGN
jgi:8-oxo-dGTP pyrophosphatase MutT (NUDIX family)